MDWIVAGVAQQAAKWFFITLVVGVGIGALLFLGVPWIFEHVSIGLKMNIH